MALIYNGTTIPYSGTVSYNGTNLTKIIYNSTTVWVQSYIQTIRKVSSTLVDNVTIVRNSSDASWASTGIIGTIASGAITGVNFDGYYGDSITISAEASEGCHITSGVGTYSVTERKVVGVNGAADEYALSISAGTGVASVTVNRDSSSLGGGTTGQLSDGAVLYYADELTVSATASSGYDLDPYTSSYTVTGDVSVSITASVAKLIAPILSIQRVQLGSSLFQVRAIVTNPNTVSCMNHYTFVVDGSASPGAGTIAAGASMNINSSPASAAATSASITAYLTSSGYTASDATTKSL